MSYEMGSLTKAQIRSTQQIAFTWTKLFLSCSA